MSFAVPRKHVTVLERAGPVGGEAVRAGSGRRAPTPGTVGRARPDGSTAKGQDG